jgi:hypothetical protein
MTTHAQSPAKTNLDVMWRRFKSSRAQVLTTWVEAERAMALANRERGASGPSGDRLLAAEAALQGAIVDFAATQDGVRDPMPVALALLRKAEAELFEDPPDLRQPASGGDRRKTMRRGIGDRRSRANRPN